MHVHACGQFTSIHLTLSLACPTYPLHSGQVTRSTVQACRREYKTNRIQVHTKENKRLSLISYNPRTMTQSAVLKRQTPVVRLQMDKVSGFLLHSQVQPLKTVGSLLATGLSQVMREYHKGPHGEAEETHVAMVSLLKVILVWLPKVTVVMVSESLVIGYLS